MAEGCEVHCINWVEHERGTGSRPDGHTLHLTQAEASRFIKDYWDSMPGQAPETYSRPGRVFVVLVDSKTHARVAKEGSIWGHPTQHHTS